MKAMTLLDRVQEAVTLYTSNPHRGLQVIDGICREAKREANAEWAESQWQLMDQPIPQSLLQAALEFHEQLLKNDMLDRVVLYGVGSFEAMKKIYLEEEVRYKLKR